MQTGKVIRYRAVKEFIGVHAIPLLEMNEKHLKWRIDIKFCVKTSKILVKRYPF